MYKHIAELVCRLPVLDPVRTHMEGACSILVSGFAAGGKLLACGNGGSAADAEHVVGELMKGFLYGRPLPEPEQGRLRERSAAFGDVLAGKLQRGLPAVALTAGGALASAVLNDLDPVLVYAQQVYALGRPGDVLLGLSTSGNAANVLAAAVAAQHKGMTVIGLTGRHGGELARLSDVAIKAPADATPAVQELHVAVYHALCADVEEHFFGDGHETGSGARP